MSCRIIPRKIDVWNRGCSRSVGDGGAWWPWNRPTVTNSPPPSHQHRWQCKRFRRRHMPSVVRCRRRYSCARCVHIIYFCWPLKCLLNVLSNLDGRAVARAFWRLVLAIASYTHRTSIPIHSHGISWQLQWVFRWTIFAIPKILILHPVAAVRHSPHNTEA